MPVIGSSLCSVGAEHAALEALKILQVPELLLNLGLNRRQRCYALGTIVARMVEPASERHTHHWLGNTSALGEMLDIDFGTLSAMNLYRISDRLIARQTQIEQHLFERACELFTLKPTIAFYDLTNTYFEGQVKLNPDAKRGPQKKSAVTVRY